MLLAILGNLILAAVATAIIWKSSERLEFASERIAVHHGVPQVVKGAVITAIASSFPELSSVVLATLVHGEFELGVGAIVGSAIFNILVIPACAVLASGKLEASRAVVYKESLFYLIAVLVLLLTFCFSVIYDPVDGSAVQGRMSRPLAMIPLLLYGVYLFIQYQDTKDHTASESRPEGVRIGREWLTLGVCMVLVAAAVELLIVAALRLGDLIGTPSFLWGLTIIAAGTSLPDLFISVQAAQDGRADSSLSNVLGSNTFDLLVAIPAGVLLSGVATVHFARAAPMMGVLTAATLAIFVLMRRNMALARPDALVLLLSYGLFVVWMLLETSGVVSLLG